MNRSNISFCEVDKRWENSIAGRLLRPILHSFVIASEVFWYCVDVCFVHSIFDVGV